ncbi:MAG: hypothetical protein R8L07_05510 [Alphaproteobacteria bacterium]|nr:hypothetical protein [Alphaproteobacteria bacterium]
MANRELQENIGTVQGRLQNILDQLQNGDLSNGEGFEPEAIISEKPVPQTIRDLAERSGQIFHRLLVSVGAADQYLLPLSWQANVKSNLDGVLAAISEIENTISNLKDERGGISGRGDDPASPRCKIRFGNGSEFDLIGIGDKIVQQVEQILSRAVMVPEDKSVKDFQSATTQVRTELTSIKEDVLSLRRVTKRASTEVQGLLEGARENGKEIVTVQDQAVAATKKAQSQIDAIGSAHKEATNLHEKTVSLKAEIDAFEAPFETFRTQLDSARDELKSAEEKAKSIEGTYSSRIETLDELDSKSRATLGLAEGASLAGKFREVETELLTRSKWALGGVVISVLTFFLLIMMFSGYDLPFVDEAYYRAYNERLMAGDWGPLKVFAVKLAMLVPAIILFGFLFTLYRRLDGERRIYTHKRTLAESAANFAELVVAEDTPVEKREILLKTFEQLVFDQTAAEIAARQQARAGVLDKFIIGQMGRFVPGVSGKDGKDN